MKKKLKNLDAKLIALPIFVLALGLGGFLYFQDKKQQEEAALAEQLKFEQWLINLPPWKYVNPEKDSRLEDRSAAYVTALEKYQGSEVLFGIRCDYKTGQSKMAMWGPVMDKAQLNTVPARVDFDRDKVLWPTFTKTKDGKILLLKDMSYLPYIKESRSMEVTLNPNGKEKKKFSFGLQNSMRFINFVLTDCKTKKGK